MTMDYKETEVTRLGEELLKNYDCRIENARGPDRYGSRVIESVKAIGGHPAGLPFLLYVQDKYHPDSDSAGGYCVEGLSNCLSEAIGAIGDPSLIPYYVDKYVARYSWATSGCGPEVHAAREVVGALSKITDHNQVAVDWPQHRIFFVKAAVASFRAKLRQPENFGLATEAAILWMMQYLGQHSDFYSKKYYNPTENFQSDFTIVNNRFFIPRGFDLFAQYRRDIDEIKRCAQQKKDAQQAKLINYPGGNYLKQSR